MNNTSNKWIPVVATYRVRHFPSHGPAVTIIMGVSSEVLDVGLALGGGHNAKGATPSFVDRFPPDCEHSTRHFSP